MQTTLSTSLSGAAKPDADALAAASPCVWDLDLFAKFRGEPRQFPLQAVADCVDAEVPESVIRQVGENEYQAKLHELQLKVQAAFSQHHEQRSCNLPRHTV